MFSLMRFHVIHVEFDLVLCLFRETGGGAPYCAFIEINKTVQSFYK